MNAAWSNFIAEATANAKAAQCGLPSRESWVDTVRDTSLPLPVTSQSTVERDVGDLRLVGHLNGWDPTEVHTACQLSTTFSHYR
ncbi:MAG: hypothetical protein KVP17_004653 [Porospora cf. gigantea B]|uniref:uncharacterized protein n=1 Tax=Porospora cf. gigantea B TaxID=2853592 RepID=UPI003571A0B7|nr:MAG: hypothetical protein KVP17_004653 [Porospora cf. gigantea B]